MKKKVLEVIRMNHPESTGILVCTYKFGRRYYVVDKKSNRTDITEELHHICRMFALDELIRRINEDKLV